MVVAVDDRVLVRAAQRGDLQAFADLVRRHQRPAFRLALHMTGSREDAEDVSQEAFFRAWRTLGRFRGDSSFSTWMHRIVTNLCLNLIAARPAHHGLPDTASDLRDDPPTTIERRERMRALEAGVRALPPDARAALVLRELQGLSYDEVAEVLGVSLAAVKGRIHRARLQLVEGMAAWR